MRGMIVASLLINIVVLIPVCGGMLAEAVWISSVYGVQGPAQGILLSVYLSIVVVSTGLLFLRNPTLVAPLLLVQVIYKLTTPFTVGSLSNPVVISNLGIAVFHAVTLYLIARAYLNGRQDNKLVALSAEGPKAGLLH